MKWKLLHVVLLASTHLHAFEHYRCDSNNGRKRVQLELTQLSQKHYAATLTIRKRPSVYRSGRIRTGKKLGPETYISHGIERWVKHFVNRSKEFQLHIIRKSFHCPLKSCRQLTVNAQYVDWKTGDLATLRGHKLYCD